MYLYIAYLYKNIFYADFMEVYCTPWVPNVRPASANIPKYNRIPKKIPCK